MSTGLFRNFAHRKRDFPIRRLSGQNGFACLLTGLKTIADVPASVRADTSSPDERARLGFVVLHPCDGNPPRRIAWMGHGSSLREKMVRDGLIRGRYAPGRFKLLEMTGSLSLSSLTWLWWLTDAPT